MFILKRQDVEITNVQHPKRDQKVTILNYQGMTFRLLNVFPSGQEEEARLLWRELTDNQGKACVLLEEPARHSIWGKVRMEQLFNEPTAAPGPAVSSGGAAAMPPVCIQAALLMLQSLYMDVEDLLGAKQSTAFQRELAQIFKQGQFAQTEGPDAVTYLLTHDPLNSLQPPAWREPQVVTLLQEMHRMGKGAFGKTTFSTRVLEVLQDMPSGDRATFQEWLGKSSVAALWR
jgi:hypothetical protein